MKKTLFVLFICLSLFANAQVDFGIIGGVNFARLKFDDISIPSQDIDINQVAERGNGFHLGGVAMIQIKGIFLQPEILYNQFSSVLTIEDMQQINAKEEELVTRRLDVPVLIGKKFSIFKLMAGPVASITLSNDSPLSDIQDVKDNYKDATFGYQLGVGFKASNLFVDVKYEGSLSKFGDGIVVDNQDINFDGRINQVYVSVGWLF
jgi:hypothetical protein